MVYSRTSEKNFRKNLDNVLYTLDQIQNHINRNKILLHLDWRVSEIIKDIKHLQENQDDYKMLMYYANGVQIAIKNIIQVSLKN